MFNLQDPPWWIVAGDTPAKAVPAQPPRPSKTAAAFLLPGTRCDRWWDLGGGLSGGKLCPYGCGLTGTFPQLPDGVEARGQWLLEAARDYGIRESPGCQVPPEHRRVLPP